jgi:hypothetical protein
MSASSSGVHTPAELTMAARLQVGRQLCALKVGNLQMGAHQDFTVQQIPEDGTLARVLGAHNSSPHLCSVNVVHSCPNTRAHRVRAKGVCGDTYRVFTTDDDSHHSQGPFYRLVTYNGSAPWSGAATTEYVTGFRGPGAAGGAWIPGTSCALALALALLLLLLLLHLHLLLLLHLRFR